MPFTIEKKDLLDIIQKVMPAVDKKAIVEEMGHLVFDGQYVLTYNDKVAISYPMPEGFDISCGVVAADFVAAVKGIRTKEVTLNHTDNGLVVYGGKYNTVLPFYDQNKIIELHASLDIDSIWDQLIELPEGFIDGLRVCKYAASDNLDNPKGVYAVKIDGGVIFATDGYQATRYPINDIGLELCFIQKTFIDGIVNFEPVYAFFNNSWAFFLNEAQAMMSCRVSNVAHAYPPNVDQVFQEFEGGFQFTEALDEELSSLEFFSEGTDKADKSINITIESSGKCILSTESKRGSVSVETEVKGFSGEQVSFIINPGALRETISHNGFMHVSERFLSLRTDNFEHVAALKAVK